MSWTYSSNSTNSFDWTSGIPMFRYQCLFCEEIYENAFVHWLQTDHVPTSLDDITRLLTGDPYYTPMTLEDQVGYYKDWVKDMKSNQYISHPFHELIKAKAKKLGL